MHLKNLLSLFSDNGCQKVYVKKLAPNDNSKNQVYLGGNFQVLNILPISEIITAPAGDWKKERFKAAINFNWITEEGHIYHAPQTQLILYPKYPEVRLSGFLAKCEKAPSDLMASRIPNRLLFFSVDKDRRVLAYVTSPETELAKEFEGIVTPEEFSLFKTIELSETRNSREKLISELRRIHLLNWIKSKRLDKNKRLVECLAPNCGGYTLEAELGIIPNGHSEPDFLGWEVKQFGVNNFERVNSSVITLMTPEPTDGFYAENGAEAFVRRFGYNDLKGRLDRMNFGGVHKVGIEHSRTKLTMELIGFDKESGKIRNTEGKIALLDSKDNEAAAWSFSSLLLHWNRKHNQACYIPSLSEKEPTRKYKYGNNILLGTGTDFQLFLNEMQLGHIYYDPGIKVENISSNSKVKNRSQFRIKSLYLEKLYKGHEIIDILKTNS